MTMKKTPAVLFYIIGTMAVVLGAGGTGFAISTEALIALKQAGFSDATVQVLVEQKTLETYAFSVQELVALKKAGLSEETIQLVVREGSFMKNREPVVYGKELRPITFTTANDIIELKKAGVSDEIIAAIIVYGSQDSDDRERERAWEMLNNVGLIVDLEKKH